MNFELKADDRVLVLPIPSDGALASLARILLRGCLVTAGAREEVDRARTAMADFDNVLVIESDLAQIPWQDAFFTAALVSGALTPEVERECKRLLAPGGRLFTEP